MAKRRKRGKLKGAAKAAFLRRMAAGRRASAGGAVRRRKHSTVSQNVPHKRTKHHRRRVRRNPPFSQAIARGRASRKLSVTGVVDQVIQGAQDAAAITAGQAVTNVVSRMIPITATIPALGVRVVVAIAAGIGAQMALGPDVGRMVLAGGLTVPMKSLATMANIPVLTGALSSDEEISRYLRRSPGLPGMGAYPQFGAYPQNAARRAGVGAYPQMGDGQGQLAMSSGLLSGGNSYF